MTMDKPQYYFIIGSFSRGIVRIKGDSVVTNRPYRRLIRPNMTPISSNKWADTFEKAKIKAESLRDREVKRLREKADALEAIKFDHFTDEKRLVGGGG